MNHTVVNTGVIQVIFLCEKTIEILVSKTRIVFLQFLREITNHILCLNIFDQIVLSHSDVVSRRRFDMFE